VPKQNSTHKVTIYIRSDLPGLAQKPFAPAAAEQNNDVRFLPWKDPRGSLVPKTALFSHCAGPVATCLSIPGQVAPGGIYWSFPSNSTKN